MTRILCAPLKGEEKGALKSWRAEKEVKLGRRRVVEGGGQGA